MTNKLLVLLFIWNLVNSCHAHGDNDHSHAISQQEVIRKDEIRLFKTGKIFEVVLVVKPKLKPNTTILISDFETNKPIADAVIDVTIGEQSFKTDQGPSPGIYDLHLGLSSSSFTITIQNSSGQSETFTFDHFSLKEPFTSLWAKGSIGFLIILGVIIAGLLGSKYARKRGIFIILLFFMPSPLWAHGEGNHHHSHDEESHTHEENHEQSHLITKTAQNIIIPKEVQFHMGILTQKVTEKSLKGSVRLIGKVISDPSGYARIQSSQSAYILNRPDHPLPLAGQKVKIGDVLVVLTPTISKIETAAQKNAIYKAESEITQYSKEVERLEKLGPYAIQKNLDNARAELEKALKQKEEILNQTFKPEFLRSPINGIIADLHVKPGEIVNPDKTIMDVVDPDKFLIEAQVFNPDIAEQLISGFAKSIFHSDEAVPLKVIGVSPKVSRQDQSIHVIFKPEKGSPDIKLDMTVEIIGELKETKPTVIVPLNAVIRDKMSSWVFVVTNPETFEPRRIRIRRIINEFAEIEEGVTVGEKIITEGAYLLYQAM